MPEDPGKGTNLFPAAPQLSTSSPTAQLLPVPLLPRPTRQWVKAAALAPSHLPGALGPNSAKQFLYGCCLECPAAEMSNWLQTLNSHSTFIPFQMLSSPGSAAASTFTKAPNPKRTLSQL